MSILLNNNPHAPGPWHVKRGGSSAQPSFTVCDLHGNPIAEILLPGSRQALEQFHATRALIEHAPQLLAAVTEYALQQDLTNGGITQHLADLIKQCGGKDLQSRVKNIDNNK